MNTVSVENNTRTQDDPNLYGSNLYVGLLLSSLSAIFIGSSFIIKKKSLITLSTSGRTRAASGGYGYLRHWLWWAGLISMGVGEALNFIAYVFAPAILVTPLGALSVLVTAVFSAYFLGEALNIVGKVGCCLCIIGSTVIVLHSPKEVEVASVEDLTEKIVQADFISYVLVVTALCLILIFYISPRYGSRNILVYISICSLIGGFSVLSCKALGLSIKEAIDGTSGLENWVTWISFPCLVFCICIQMNYLNKALDAFNTSVVTPIYYVFFTASVIIASAVLFKEWQGMDANDVIGILCGFMTVVLAIFLLHTFKDANLSGFGISMLNSINFATYVDGPSLSANHLSETRNPLLRSAVYDEEDILTVSYGSDKRGS